LYCFGFDGILVYDFKDVFKGDVAALIGPIYKFLNHVIPLPANLY
jgi:hypothetical protein